MDRRVHDDDFPAGVNEDALPAYAEEREGLVGAADEPRLVAVAVELGGDAALEVRRMDARHFLHPRGRDDLLAVDRAVVHKQEPEPAPVAERRVQAHVAELVATAV